MTANTIIRWSAILGASLFALTAIVSGFQFDDYSHLSQYISEAYASDAPFGPQLRWAGYIPSGILLALFGFTAGRASAGRLTSVGLLGVGVFYGLGTVVVSLFPCDPGCNIELVDPSASQIVHSVATLFTYTFVPLSLLLTGLGLRLQSGRDRLANPSLLAAAVSALFVGLLLSNPTGDLVGLFQRVIEGTILSWIVIYGCVSTEARDRRRVSTAM